MKTNVRSILIGLSAIVVALVLVRQESELRHLRRMLEGQVDPSGQASGFSLFGSPEISGGRDGREAGRIDPWRSETEESIAAAQARIDTLVRAVHELSSGAAELAMAPHEVLKAAPFLETSPEEAARWVADLPPGDEQDRAAMVVVERWSGINPSEAAAWTSGFAEGPLKEKAMYAVARRWGMRDDRRSAANWLETLSTGPSTDAAIRALVMSADGYDIELAAEWANRIGNEKNRGDLVEGVARRWLNEDKPTARAWILETPLPPGIEERLLGE